MAAQQSTHDAFVGRSSPIPCNNSLAMVPPHVEILRCLPAPPKSSSERGRAFRARRKKQAAMLQLGIATLQREIDALTRRKALGEAALLQRRHTPGGSLCRLVETYYRLFSRGFREPPVDAIVGVVSTAARQKAQMQRQCVVWSHDEDVSLGTPHQSGHAALLTQWQLYAAAHSKFEGAVVSIEVAGSADAPVIIVQSRVETRISKATFEVLFPHLLENGAVQNRLTGRDVVYESKARFRFSPENRICSEEMEMDLISGLQRAGISLADIALLMTTPTLSSAHTIEAPLPSAP